MHLYFIRHGESTSNYGALITGQQDVPLTEKGREQAREAGREIVTRGIHIDHIICSPLARAHDTARLIAHEISYPEAAITVNDLVIERSFGTLEGTTNDGSGRLTDEIIEKSGGELDPAIRTRAQLFLESLKETRGTVLVVSHTGFGRRLRAVVSHIPTAESANFKNAELIDLGEVE
ncbi:MAG TPA: histidine phosphatase family protein [Candidatus Microsaccharimonas sp.]|jgi:probable phosphoglycerate mutase